MFSKIITFSVWIINAFVGIISNPLYARGQSESQDVRSQFERGLPLTVTPDAGPRLAHGANIFIFGGFIYWKAVQDGLEYAQSGTINTDGIEPTSRGHTHSPDFHWNPGFKVGLEYGLPYDGWDLKAQYTWYRSSHNHDMVRSDQISQSYIVGPINTNAAFLQSPSLAKTRWNLHFNVLDLELGRNYYISRFLTFRPFGGLKFTWQDQNWSVLFQSDRVTLGGAPEPGMVRSSQDHDLWGAGIRTGLDGSWYLYKGWNLFLNTALSAVWTDYGVERTDRFQQDTDPLPTITNLTKLKEYSVKGVIEFQLGLKGEWWFSDRDYYLSISAAYEQQVWLNYGNYIFILDKETGDLSLHGGTFKVKLGF